MSQWINLTGDAWALIFLAYFVLLIVVSGISVFRPKKFSEMPLLGSVLTILHFLWVIPVAILIFVKGLPLIIAMMAIFMVGAALLLGFTWISGVIGSRRTRKR